MNKSCLIWAEEKATKIPCKYARFYSTFACLVCTVNVKSFQLDTLLILWERKISLGELQARVGYKWNSLLFSEIHSIWPISNDKWSINSLAGFNCINFHYSLLLTWEYFDTRCQTVEKWVKKIKISLLTKPT